MAEPRFNNPYFWPPPPAMPGQVSDSGVFTHSQSAVKSMYCTFSVERFVAFYDTKKQFKRNSFGNMLNLLSCLKLEKTEITLTSKSGVNLLI